MDNQENVVNSESALKHIYIDVEADTLSKATALCDLISIAKEVPAVIFANTPSEADMLENVLNKNSVKSAKLIGHVPYAKIAEAVKRAKDGEVQAVVVTDVASREMDIGSFKTLINYAIHEDPEIYLHRFAGLDANSKLEKVISLISPQDFGNFHYIKKIMDFPFEQGALPDKSDFFREQAAELIAKAQAYEVGENQKMKIFVEEIEKAGASAAIIPFLLNNLFTIVSRPAAENQRRERNNRNKPAYDNNYDNEPREERIYIPKEELPKFSRIYIGHGSDHGLTEEMLQKCVSESETPTEITRVTIRGNYGFVDVPMEQSEAFMEKVASLSVANGESVYLKRATSITALREAGANDNHDSQENIETEVTNNKEEEEASA